MWKITAESLRFFIMPCQRLAFFNRMTKLKHFSQSHKVHKTYSIKNHMDFDQKVIHSDHPVVVDFHAEWCDPCKKLTPRMAELLDNSEEIDLAIIDVETNTDLVEEFKINSVPTVYAYRNGEIVHKFIGLVEANILKSMIDKLKNEKSQTIKPTESTESPEK